MLMSGNLSGQPQKSNYSNFVEYEEKTDRVIPVIMLEPR